MGLISIIVPVYNVEPYLSRCIDSILQQTYKDIEIILIDDGSTDRCGKICDEYLSYDNRIKVIHQSNRGLSHARNAGIALAQGTYIGFVDPDDWIAPDMYQQLYNLITRYEADIVDCNGYTVNGNDISAPPKIENTTKVYSSKEAIYALTKGKINISACYKLYKKEILSDTTFPAGLNFEDLYAMPGILKRCSKIVSVDTPYYYYLQREGSICHTYDVKHIRDYFHSSSFSNRQISNWYPDLKPLTDKAQIKNDITCCYLLAITKPGPKRKKLLDFLAKDLKQYPVSWLFCVPARRLPATFIIRFAPEFFLYYDAVRRFFNNLIIQNGIGKLKSLRSKNVYHKQKARTT